MTSVAQHLGGTEAESHARALLRMIDSTQLDISILAKITPGELWSQSSKDERAPHLLDLIRNDREHVNVTEVRMAGKKTGPKKKAEAC